MHVRILFEELRDLVVSKFPNSATNRDRHAGHCIFALHGGKRKADAKITATTPTSSRIFEESLMDANATKANKVAETVSRNSNKAFGVTVTKEGSIERNTGFTVSI